MSEKRPILEGDVVTIDLSEYQSVSNTYIVAKKLENQAFLKHPLAPDCYILKNDTDLNNALAMMQSQVERCLVYAKKNREFLGYSMAEDLEALCYYFVIRKDFTQKQRHDLSYICGKIASVVMKSNLSTAISTIKQNKILLDEYHHSLINSVKPVIDNPMSLKTKGERFTIFNIAGFILAQISY